jgi:hypothetical protein
MDWNEKLDALPDDERRLITKIARTWLARGEDVSTVAKHVRRWIDKNNGDNDGASEGSKPPQDRRDPVAELEDLVDAHMRSNRISRSTAYSRVLAARSDLNAALAHQRDAKLRKAARAFGDGRGCGDRNEFADR